MTINPKCYKCGKELDDYGGILLSPPDSDGNVKKLHLCKKCYKVIQSQLDKT